MIRLPERTRRRIPLTPLIDVVFLLVMFFMLSSTFAPLRSLDVGVSSRGTGAGAAAGPTLFLVIEAPAPGTQDPRATLDGEPVTSGQLEAALRARAGDEAASVLLQLREGTSVQDLVTALEAVRTSGVGSVQVLTR